MAILLHGGFGGPSARYEEGAFDPWLLCQRVEGGFPEGMHRRDGRFPRVYKVPLGVVHLDHAGLSSSGPRGQTRETEGRVDIAWCDWHVKRDISGTLVGRIWVLGANVRVSFPWTPVLLGDQFQGVV